MKTSFFLAAFFFSIACSGQISIDFSDMLQVGDTVTRYADTMTTLTAGPSGENQSWVMTTATTHLTLVTKGLAPTSTPYASSFTNSNIAMTNDNLSYLYSNQNSSASVIKGAAGDLLMTGCNITTPFIPDMLLHNFPRNYGSNFTDDYAMDVTINGSCVNQSAIDKVRFKRVSTVSDTTDGWGTITTPVGTYQCLRIKRVEFSTDSTWVKPFFPSAWTFVTAKKDTIFSYSWIAKEGKLAIAELEFDTLDNPKKFTWSGILSGSVNIAQSEDPEEKFIFPNPASEKIYFSGLRGKLKGTIFDASGRLVESTVLFQDLPFLDVSNYENGMYFLLLINEEGGISGREKFIIED